MERGTQIMMLLILHQLGQLMMLVNLMLFMPTKLEQLVIQNLS